MPRAEATVSRVAAYFGIPAAELPGRSRAAYMAYARHLAMWLLWTDSLCRCCGGHGVTITEIGRLLHRDRATVRAGIDLIEAERKRDAATAYDLRLLAGVTETVRGVEALSKER